VAGTCFAFGSLGEKLSTPGRCRSRKSPRSRFRGPMQPRQPPAQARDADFVALACVVAGHTGRQRRLARLQREQAHFDAAAGHQLVLADALYACASQVFDGRVPSGVDVGHGVGGGKREEREDRDFWTACGICRRRGINHDRHQLRHGPLWWHRRALVGQLHHVHRP